MGRFLGVDFPESVEGNRGQKRGVFPSPKHGFVATFCAISGQKILESVEENRGQKKSSKKVRFFVKIAFWRFSGLEGFWGRKRGPKQGFGVQNRVLGVSGGGFNHISQGFGVQNRLWELKKTASGKAAQETP